MAFNNPTGKNNPLPRQSEKRKSPSINLAAVRKNAKPGSLANIDKPLTQRQRAYVNALVREKMNHMAAARIAGFPINCLGSALRSLKNSPKVQKAIAIEQAQFEKASMMSKKRVIDGLLEAIDMARVQGDPTPMIQGWTQIAKMCGYMEPTKHKLEVSVNGNVVIQKLQQLGDEELLALADGHTDALEGEFIDVTPTRE